MWVLGIELRTERQALYRVISPDPIYWFDEERLKEALLLWATVETPKILLPDLRPLHIQ